VAPCSSGLFGQDRSHRLQDTLNRGCEGSTLVSHFYSDEDLISLAEAILGD
jgi:hypothetical protein